MPESIAVLSDREEQANIEHPVPYGFAKFRNEVVEVLPSVLNEPTAGFQPTIIQLPVQSVTPATGQPVPPTVVAV